MDLSYTRKNIWNVASADKKRQIRETAEAFKSFNDASKTERLCVKELVRRAEEKGFRNLLHMQDVKPGDRVYYNDNGKLLYLAVAGCKALTEGAALVVSHTDSPRLDLKIMPLYEEGGFAYLKTSLYGSAKLEKWTSTPLAMFGTVMRIDGSMVEIAEGQDEEDSVLFITDASLHYSQEQNERKQGAAYDQERMNLFAASRAESAEETVKHTVLRYLYEKYGVTEEDLIGADLEIVPAGRTRDAGFDRSALCGYGFDDKAAVFAAMEGIFSCVEPKRTAIAVFCDKEEIGFCGRSGSQSRVTDYFLRLLAEKSGCAGDGIVLNQIQLNSSLLSLEAVCGFDPNYPESHEKYNGSLLGHGLQLMKYASRYGKIRTSEASAEFFSIIKKLFNDHGVVWQPFAGKENFGGFSTVAVDFANMGMETLDAAICVLGAHSTYEFMLKSDLHEACIACSVYLNA
ncbi:hypothetical protein ACPW7J_10820 [Ihubacter sp. rT4E-8]|uniref:hypothetical protein n=1 Tax=Ihubacter sp. rT4E-8 TaxID=3242369 RepID=UPI003CF8847C